MTRRSALGRLALVVAGTLPLGIGARADGPSGSTPSTWAWLVGRERTDGVVLAPGLSEEEQELARRVLPSVVAIAAARPPDPPRDQDVRGAGLVVRSDGLVATAWRLLRVERRESTWLWARAHDGAWQRLIPLGATWWGDVGLARIAGLRRRWPAVAWGDVGREGFGQRFLALGSPEGRPFVASAGRLGAISSFDPAEANGRHEWTRNRRIGPTSRAEAISLRFAEDLSTSGGAGSPIFDAGGACVGMVVGGDGARGKEESVTARPAAFLRRFLDPMMADAAFDPPDFGVRFAPPGTDAEDLARAREKGKGGAVVGHVLAEGPANHVLWEGDVVLEIEGRPVFAEVPESIALATIAAPLGVPTDVVVWRGGRRQSLQVTAVRGRSLYADFVAEHDARAVLATSGW